MPYLIGTDEAGYGPNLGPLVISTSVWWVPDDDRGVDLYHRLAGCVVDRLPRKRSKLADVVAPVAIADSKQLFKPRGGLAALERGVLGTLSLLDRRPSRWREIWSRLHADRQGACDELPWYASFDEPLPRDLSVADLDASAASLHDGLQVAGVRLVDLRSVAVFPGEFNTLVEEYDGKGLALSRLTLGLLADVLEPLDEPVLVICDKHGGRNRYGELLQQWVTEQFVEIRCEGRAESIYRFGPAETRTEVQFRTGGESFLPAALASMASKYLRELAMGAFNEYWAQQVPGLRPTAGYPLDARRFKQEIAEAQQALGVDDANLWRCR